MNYVVLQIYVDANGTISHPAQHFDNYEDAASRYYGILASAVKSQYPVHSVILMTEECFELEHKCFKREVTPVEPEPEPTEGE